MTADLGDETAHGDNEAGPRDHRGLRVLTLDECVRHLRAALVGRIAFLHEGEPVIFPVNYAVDGLDVVFRSTWGSKLEHAQHAGTVAFEVDGSDDEQRLGWSVLVTGVADVVYDEQQSDRLDRLALRGWATTTEPTFWVRIRAEQVTGRAIDPPPTESAPAS